MNPPEEKSLSSPPIIGTPVVLRRRPNRKSSFEEQALKPASRVGRPQALSFQSLSCDECATQPRKIERCEPGKCSDSHDCPRIFPQWPSLLEDGKDLSPQKDFI